MSKAKAAIPANKLFAKWRKDPKYRRAYAEAEPEFTMAAALIQARTQAELTQEQLAKLMGTSQSAIARLESGKFKPSHGTLEKFAKATGTRLRVSFERVGNGI